MRRLALALLVGSICSATLAASAQDDGGLTLMREPPSYVDVVDAFDDDDPFDVNVSASFIRRWTYGTIQREDNAGASDPNRMSRNWRDIARHDHEQNILQLGVDVGVFRDLAIYGYMPIILSDDRRLSTVAGGPSSVPDSSLAPGGMLLPEPLFTLPFNSPTRSGFDYIAAGLAWSIFNQNRERELPTWVLMVEGRFNVGDPMIPCRQDAGSARCRSWSQGGGGDWGFTETNDAGETRGTNALRIETRASWRTRYVEPFAGLLFHIEWPDAADRFFLPAGDISGIVNEQPPIIGQFTGGLAIIPWENRANWQRFAIDLRVMGKYVSEGHGYSPLFDALGTSASPYLTEPNLEGEPGTGADLRTVPFFGLTDMQAHAELGGQIGVEMRAARLIRFGAMAELWYVQPYILTFADACNPNFTDAPEDDPRRGTCRRGIINPHHRPVLDLPGQQFRVNEQVRFNFMFNVTGMF